MSFGPPLLRMCSQRLGPDAHADQPLSRLAYGELVSSVRHQGLTGDTYRESAGTGFFS